MAVVTVTFDLFNLLKFSKIVILGTANMDLRYLSVHVLVIIGCLVGYVEGYGSGAPVDHCADMLPSHDAQPQASASPYTISFEGNTYTHGERKLSKYHPPYKQLFDCLLLLFLFIFSDLILLSISHIPTYVTRLTYGEHQKLDTTDVYAL